MNYATVISTLLLIVFATGAAEFHLSSPDERIKLSIDSPRWSATFGGKPILTNCNLGLELLSAGDLLRGARVLHNEQRSVDHRVRVHFGKSEFASDRYRELRLTLETPQKHRLDVVFRCYDDAVALRYELPASEAGASATITDETTSFQFAGNPTAYVQYLEHYKTSHEHTVQSVPYTEIRRGTLLDLPLTFSWADGTYAAITEAALRQYAGHGAHAFNQRC